LEADPHPIIGGVVALLNPRIDTHAELVTYTYRSSIKSDPEVGSIYVKFVTVLIFKIQLILPEQLLFLMSSSFGT